MKFDGKSRVAMIFPFPGSLEMKHTAFFQRGSFLKLANQKK